MQSTAVKRLKKLSVVTHWLASHIDRIDTIRLSDKFLSFYEEIIDAQRFLFYIILSNYVRFILFCWDKLHDIL